MSESPPILGEMADLREEVARISAAFAQVCEEKAKAEAAFGEKIASMQVIIDWLRKQVFGTGKSEKLDEAQLRLGLEEQERPVETQTQEITFTRKVPKQGQRQTTEELLAHIPVTKEVVIEPDEVLKNPDLYERIGEEVTYKLDIEQPKFTRTRYVFPKYRCKLDRSLPPVIAAAPKTPIECSYASPNLLAYIALSKYADHLPLHRLEKMSVRWGVRISRQTMCDWIKGISICLEPIHALMKKELLSGSYLQVDETPVKFNDPSIRDGQTKHGRMWVLRDRGGTTIYEWRLTRAERELRGILTGYGGILHSDAYEAYNCYTRGDPSRIRVGCWAHTRRKFVEAMHESPRQANLVLEQIKQLYALEREWDEKGYLDPDHRTALRKEHFEVPLKTIKETVETLRAQVRPKSGLGKACTYILGDWNALVRHCEHGITRLDTNLVENAIRPSAIGRKNWLYIGHPNAGQRSAIIYSMIISCRNHGKDPGQYLRDVLQRLPYMTNQDDLTPLTPAHWQPPAVLPEIQQAAAPAVS